MYGGVCLRPDQESAVWLWTGPPRSGKSYHAVMVILGWVRRGGFVVTNIAFTRHVEGVTVVSDDELSPVRLCETVENLRSGLGRKGVLVVIDEASIHWDSREWAKVSGDVRGWLATVGHRGVSLVVIGQSVTMIDSTIRRLARFHVEHSDATGGWLGLFTSDVRKWVLYEGMDEDWTTVRERGWFVVGPGLPYKSAEFFRGSVVSGFGIRFIGLVILSAVVYFGAVYGSRYSMIIYQRVRGVAGSVAGFGQPSVPADPFGAKVRVCGICEGGVLVEDSSGEFRVVPVVVGDDWVGRTVSVGELLGMRAKVGDFAKVK